MPTSPLAKKARRVAALLKRKRKRLVLAESCTGGRVASLFTEIPGVSEVFCGSHVVYREASKRAWLGVGAKTLAKHGAVSDEVAEAMVRGALKRTPEADLAGSITGYLGPTGKRVGLVYVSVLRRGDRVPRTFRFEIAPIRARGAEARRRRREIAGDVLLQLLIFSLRN